MPSQVKQLRALGRVPLLILLDYDGTLVPSEGGPVVRRPDETDLQTLRCLLASPDHAVFIMTGRRREALQRHLGVPARHVVGLHGLQWPSEEEVPVSRADAVSILSAMTGLEHVVPEDRGQLLVAHVPHATPHEKSEVLAELLALPLPAGWVAAPGAGCVEYRPGGLGVGRVAWRLARAHPRRIPVYFSAAMECEAGFAAFKAIGGTGVKVGPGPTCAPYHLRDSRDVFDVLRAWTVGNDGMNGSLAPSAGSATGGA